MRSTTNRIFKNSIVVWPADLEYLDASLRKTFGDVKYLIRCEDETKPEPPSLKELLAYENPDFRRIASITIKASDDKPFGDNVTIILGKSVSYSDSTISANFEFADIQKQTPVEDEIVKRLLALRPWHYWFPRVSFMALLPFALYGYSIILNAISLVQKQFGFVQPVAIQPRSSIFTEGEQIVYWGAVIGILILAGYVLDRSRDYFLPRRWFCIGRQQQAYEKRRSVANLIFVVVILGFLINIVAAIVAPK